MQIPLPFRLDRHWVFLAFLVALHLVFLQGPETALGRLLFLAHAGVGLLWQPFVQPRHRIGTSGATVVILCATLFAYFLNWGLLLVWTMLLVGVAGGKVFLYPGRGERVFHLLGLGYLTIATLALVLPKSLAVLSLAEPALERLVLYVVPVVFVAMALWPGKLAQREDRGEIVNYIYGVLVFLLLAVIALGSLSFALIFKTSYAESLLMTLALVSGILLLLGFIWNPRAGFGGLGSALAQHVMSLGLPIEGWLEFVSELARSEEDPERFLARACDELPRRLPGVVGGRWTGHATDGTFGEQQGQRILFAHGHPKFELVTTFSPGPALRWDYDLAIRFLGEQYLGKRRAQELRRLSYFEAIHETGARLTHDVKNLLQSMETLCVAAQRETTASSPQFKALLLRQLPEIAARLRQTLAKLSAPGRSNPSEPVLAALWLEALESRSGAAWIDFVAAGDVASTVIRYPEMFSGVAENLLQNIADKRRAAPGLRAEARLFYTPNGVVLEVSDDGAAIATELAPRLFSQQVPSENGLGIGLYQSARLAEEHNHRLLLAENHDGCVCFRLAPVGAG